MLHFILKSIQKHLLIHLLGSGASSEETDHPMENKITFKDIFWRPRDPIKAPQPSSS